HRRAIEPVVEAQRVGPDARQAAGEAAQLARPAIQRRAREGPDVARERMHAVERRRRRPQFIQVAEIVVDEMLNGFERVHGRARRGSSCRGPALPGTVGGGKQSHVKWYNNGSPSSAAGRSRPAPVLEVVCPTRRRPAHCSSWRRRSVTSKTLRYAPSECCAKCRSSLLRIRGARAGCSTIYRLRPAPSACTGTTSTIGRGRWSSGSWRVNPLRW